MELRAKEVKGQCHATTIYLATALRMAMRCCSRKKNSSALAKIYIEYVFECNMYNKNERWEYNQSRRTAPLRFTIREWWEHLGKSGSSKNSCLHCFSISILYFLLNERPWNPIIKISNRSKSTQGTGYNTTLAQQKHNIQRTAWNRIPN